MRKRELFFFFLFRPDCPPLHKYPVTGNEVLANNEIEGMKIDKILVYEELASHCFNNDVKLLNSTNYAVLYTHALTNNYL